MNEIDFTRYDLVSFDVFDTLVSRLVSTPADVFKIVELRATQEGLDALGFSVARAEAEKQARADSVRGEVTLDEIYDALLFGQFGHDIPRMKELELQVERDVCIPRPEGMRLYEEALASEKRIIITSDMYLPKGFILELLYNCGYRAFEKVFVSCEYGCTKSTGVLFRTVIQNVGCEPGRIVHIGDNQHSDYRQSRKEGLAAYLIDPPDRSLIDTLSESVIHAARQVSLASRGSFDTFGYGSFGPILVGFCGWLADELQKRGIEKVYFLARDGLVIKQAFETLYPGSFECRYFYASRRALQIPSFCLCGSLVECLSLISLPRTVTPRKLFFKLGLGDEDAGDIAAVADATSLVLDDPIPSDQLASHDAFTEAFVRLFPIIKARSENQLGLLREYLVQEGFGGDVAIVDIGWYGSMQRALTMIADALSIDAQLWGFYVGLSAHARAIDDTCMFSYLFGPGRNESLFAQQNQYNALFEILFSARHGTTRGYRRGESCIEPILADYEDAEAQTGADAEQAQTGALKFAGDWARIFSGATISVSPSTALSSLNQVGTAPTEEDVQAFGGWAMEDDGAVRYLAKPASLKTYLLHPSLLAHDYASSYWKPGFRARLGLPRITYRFIDHFYRHGLS